MKHMTKKHYSGEDDLMSFIRVWSMLGISLNKKSMMKHVKTMTRQSERVAYWCSVEGMYSVKGCSRRWAINRAKGTPEWLEAAQGDCWVGFTYITAAAEEDEDAFWILGDLWLELREAVTHREVWGLTAITASSAINLPFAHCSWWSTLDLFTVAAGAFQVGMCDTQILLIVMMIHYT